MTVKSFLIFYVAYMLTPIFAGGRRAQTTFVAQPNKKVQLITFDLDDTLFPIANVIEDSNQRLIQSLHSLGFKRTTLEGFTNTTRRVRLHLESNEPGKVFRYTEIRKLAIQHEMVMSERDDDHSTMNLKIATTILPDYCHKVQSVYSDWENERHASAERHLYPDTLTMLQQIQNYFPHAILGAITNGKGNPLFMTRTLAPFFNFCVSGEDDNVFPYRKPHAKIFQVALECAEQEMIGSNHGNIKTYSIEQDEDTPLSSSWFHIGDDLCNDISASAACGAKAIWLDLAPEYGQTSSKRLQGLNPSWSTASSAEMEQRRVLSQAALEYSITARVEKLSELPSVLVALHDT